MKWLKKFLSAATPNTDCPEEVPTAERVRQLVAIGSKMALTEDYTGAMEAFTSALRLDSRCAPAWKQRGGVYLQGNQILEALACYAYAVELDNRRSESWQGLGLAILSYLKAEEDPLLIRSHRLEIVSEAHDCLIRAQNLGSNQTELLENIVLCEEMIGKYAWCVADPRLFIFRPGGILENAKREVISPFLKPSDYRRKAIPAAET